ncbi:hypothetical protein H7J77_06515 [Mycolicibacillus parakoreensis]|uniref:Lipoprotein n=1 Tax=Mycolicibacillus parakoreensis TaxID=1069221 RepID=A0ABY3U5U4_9MYCO|nr:DUF6636 domain-containing protein [Mycolicibacillus parakoreensis]MCV7315191.1 hypothetical protein [Mycolicibacillus parakoreensis]ULN53471.1 hypothetical protein MIU77_03770 [Mycolicibacillus parakoreensis]
MLAALAVVVAGGCLGEPMAVADDENFQSPDGNIACYAIEKYVQCDITERDWSAPRPADCATPNGYGAGIVMSSGGEPELVCGGGIFGNPARADTLGYGQTYSMSNYHCDSSEAGITCVNVIGHGFMIGRAAYRLF